MRFSETYIPTLREAPQDAELASHRLMMRAGMMRKLSSGIYSFLPLGWKVIQKMIQIIREEMNRSGALEVSLPVVQPKELWEESGRWQQYGKELLRFEDRHENEFCLQPTSEEVVTDLVRRDLNSYRQLPINLYQIQTKFRDEIRPRFGVMRGREFLMKDAYSFDVNEAMARKSYERMRKAYHRIFTRTGLRFRSVQADTGSIGGKASEEFVVLAQAGEDEIIFDSEGSYAANQEMAESRVDLPPACKEAPEPEKFATPGLSSIEDLAGSLQCAPSDLMKTMVVLDEDSRVFLVLLRGDHELNLVKLRRFTGIASLRLALDEDLQALRLPKGSLGPYRFPVEHRLFVDSALNPQAIYCCGANEEGFHYRNVQLQRDASGSIESGVFRDVKVGELCLDSNRPLSSARGIEVGHVFYLGTKYSESLKLQFKAENGKETFVEMGCYGIGVGRSVAAAIEQNHDEHGICWPLSLAPYEVGIVCLGEGEPEKVAEELYQFFRKNSLDVLLDDRKLSAGVKLKDMDLIGVPYQVIVGDRALKEGCLEWKCRASGHKDKIPLTELRDKVLSTLKEERSRIGSLCDSIGY